MKIYPAIDLYQRKYVRLTQGEFSQIKVYGDDPVRLAQSYAGVGAQFLHVVDLEGAKTGIPTQTDLILEMAKETRLKIQVGGGIRTLQQIENLVKGGVDRVVVGSVIIKSPGLAFEMLKAFGADRITFAMDVRFDSKGEPWVATQGWQEPSSNPFWEVLDHYASCGLKYLLCTDIGRDGMLNGPSLQLYSQLRSRHPSFRVLASGGVGTLDDLKKLKEFNLDSVIIGKALYENRFTLWEALQC